MLLRYTVGVMSNTNNEHPLKHFVTRDQDGNYDNEYNNALIYQERQEALRGYGRHILRVTSQSAVLGALCVSRGLRDGLQTFLDSAS